MKNYLQKGQRPIAIVLWAIGLMATAGLGLNINGMNTNARQDHDISSLNREAGESAKDISYIKQAVDELKANQKEQFRIQGLPWRSASTTIQ